MSSAPNPRIVSLWALLEEVDPEGVVKAVSLLASAAKQWDVLNQQALMNRVPFLQADIADLRHVLWALELLRASAENLQMVGVVRNIDRTAGWTAEVVKIHGNVPQPTLSQLATAIASVVSAFGDEMDGRKVFVMQPRFASFYDPDKPLFGASVDQSFPSSAPEISEAGKCMALGRWTAAVMHLMRSLEPGLHALQTAVKVQVPKEQWGQILDQIESKIKLIRKKTHGKADEQWFAEAATSFGFLKDAWRNYANHLHERYDEERAEAIYHHVRAFMKHLSARLAETS